jgi:hypothetical protein
VMEMWKLDRRRKVWTQKRLSQEKDYVREKSKSQRDKAAKRWNKAEKSDAVALPEGCPVDAPTPTPTPIVIEEPNGSSRPPAVDHVGQAFADYERLRHAIVPNARAAQLSSDRRKKLAARLNDIGGAEGWANILSIVHASPFLSGERTGRLVATIDWLLEPKNLRKVMEGNYDDADRSHLAAPTGSSVRNSPIDALSVAIAASGLDR